MVVRCASRSPTIMFVDSVVMFTLKAPPGFSSLFPSDSAGERAVRTLLFGSLFFVLARCSVPPPPKKQRKKAAKNATCTCEGCPACDQDWETGDVFCRGLPAPKRQRCLQCENLATGDLALYSRHLRFQVEGSGGYFSGNQLTYLFFTQIFHSIV